MKTFAGLVPFTTIDFPGELACVVFLPGCCFKCPYCHNKELVEGTFKDVLSIDALYTFLQARKNALTGVVISGGDPDIYSVSEIKTLAKEIQGYGMKVKLDSTFIINNRPGVYMPEVDAFAMDLKAPFYKLQHFVSPFKVQRALYYGSDEPYYEASDERSDFEELVALRDPDKQPCYMNAEGKDAVSRICVKVYTRLQQSLDNFYKLYIDKPDLKVEFRTTVHRALLTPEDLKAMRTEYFGDRPELNCKWVLQQFNRLAPDMFDPSLKETPTYTDEELTEIAASLGATVRGTQPTEG